MPPIAAWVLRFGPPHGQARWRREATSATGVHAMEEGRKQAPPEPLSVSAAGCSAVPPPAAGA